MTTVWLGRGVSNNVGLIEALRARQLSVVVSHTLDHWAGQEYAASFTEPDIEGAEYVYWAADTLTQKGFDYFIPGRCLGDFSSFPKQLSGKLVMGCAAQTSNELDDKAIFYKKCHDANLDFVADFACFTNRTTFEKASDYLKKRGHDKLCFKPVKGVFAQGFRILTDANPLDVLFQDRLTTIRTEDFLRWLDERPEHDLPSMILMPLFDGKELSIDGSFDGTHYRMVARLKNNASSQSIMVDEEVYDTGMQIARLFDLKGLFNIQLMYHQGKPMVLEVNPRPAGGLAMSLLSEVDLIPPQLFGIDEPGSDLYRPQVERDIVSTMAYFLKQT